MIGYPSSDWLHMAKPRYPGKYVDMKRLVKIKTLSILYWFDWFLHPAGIQRFPTFRVPFLQEPMSPTATGLKRCIEYNLTQWLEDGHRWLFTSPAGVPLSSTVWFWDSDVIHVMLQRFKRSSLVQAIRNTTVLLSLALLSSNVACYALCDYVPKLIISSVSRGIWAGRAGTSTVALTCKLVSSG